MGKRKTPLATGEYYHIYNCGPDKRDIFTNERDFGYFLLLLEHCNDTEPIRHLSEKVDWSNKKEIFIRNRVPNSVPLVTIEGYCVLANHFHLIVRQECENGISEFMRRVCGGYSRKYNKVHQTIGTRFQGRFQAKHIDSDEYLYELMAYVPANYLVHGLHKNTLYKTNLTNAFGDNMFITNSALLKDNFTDTKSYMRFAMPKIKETRKRRGKDDLFDE